MGRIQNRSVKESEYKMGPGAIVIGGHFQGLGAVRALARQGIDVVVIDKEHCISRFSRYCSRFYKSPDVLDHKKIYKFLESLSNIKGMKGRVIFPTDDETVHFLSTYHTRLSDKYRLITPDWTIVKNVYNKKLSYKLASKLDIPIPASFFPGNFEELGNHNLRYPVIIKPAVMRPFFKVTGKKVFKAVNESELRKAYKLAATIIDPEEIIIQEQIPEPGKNLYSYCPVMDRGRVLASITAQRLRQHPMDFGRATTFAETKIVKELEPYAVRFLKAIDYSGLAEVEFIYDIRDNAYKFLEVNPRIWGWHSIASGAGVNLPYLAYKQALGRYVRAHQFKTGIKWFRVITDVPVGAVEIIKGNMTVKDFINSYRGRKEFAVFSWNDPIPFFGELLLLPYLYKVRGF
ncbi:ATP-grasp domain-containing protein [bacterium]|nr:ATP-grasp domain-containing protein [bacterium]